MENKSAIKMNSKIGTSSFYLENNSLKNRLNRGQTPIIIDLQYMP